MLGGRACAGRNHALGRAACVPAGVTPRCPDTAHGLRVETVLIEGHTDSVPLSLSSPFQDNTELSAARAMRVMEAMVDTCPELAGYRTRYDPADASTAQPVLGIAGYGEKRLKRNVNGLEDRAASRRVELRVIMRPPATGAGRN